MLAEIWERLRGYDKWTATEATILSSKLVKMKPERPWKTGHKSQSPDGGWQSNCVISWTDALSSSHKGRYWVSEGSRLFQLYDGQTVGIRYDPANPVEYYLRELSRQKARFILKRVFLFVYLAFLCWRAVLDFGPSLVRHLR
ncbi:MAG: DUF3592 domain-containing protein [Terracidiphilus sp.]